MYLEVQNSFSKLTGNVPEEVKSLVTQVLTYKNDIDAEVSALYGVLKRCRYSINKLERDIQYNPSLEGDLRKKRNSYRATEKKIQHLKANEYVCWFKDNEFPTGHLEIVKETLSYLNVDYKLLDHRKKPKSKKKYKWNEKPFDPRYYQEEAISRAIKSGRGVIESAVGTGKSLMMAYILQDISKPSIIIEPSRGLVDQMKNDFSKWFGKDMVEVIDTKKVRAKKKLKPIRFTTIQSLASLQKSGELDHLLQDVEGLFGDEIHHAGSASYTNLLPEIDHIYHRYGFSGTFLRNDSKSLDMWGFLSTVLYKYSAKRAIEDGFLTPFKLTNYHLNKHGKNAKSYHKEYDQNYCGSPEFLNLIYKICEENQGKQILILVNKKDKAGKVIHEILNHLGMANEYISGDNKKEEITLAIDRFNAKINTVLIGSSVIGEGIDIRSTDHLILAQGGKSEIAIVQAIGRLVRLFEGKSEGHLHDFNFLGTKWMGKHFLKRQEIIQRNFGCENIETVTV